MKIFHTEAMKMLTRTISVSFKSFLSSSSARLCTTCMKISKETSSPLCSAVTRQQLQALSLSEPNKHADICDSITHDPHLETTASCTFITYKMKRRRCAHTCRSTSSSFINTFTFHLHSSIQRNECNNPSPLPPTDINYGGRLYLD